MKNKIQNPEEIKIGCWQMMCCELDLEQIATQEEVDAIKSGMAEEIKENGDAKLFLPKIYNSFADAMNDNGALLDADLIEISEPFKSDLIKTRLDNNWGPEIKKAGLYKSFCEICDDVNKIYEFETIIKTLKSENEKLKSDLDEIYKTVESLTNECEQLLGSVNSCMDAILRMKDSNKGDQ